jgi:diguanylate cyclase (GGDEF)-like protein
MPIFIAHLSESRRRWLILVVSLGLIAVLGGLDYLTTSDFSLALFYLLPISLVVWEVGDAEGFLFILLSIGVWVGTDLLDGEAHLQSPVYYWDALIRFSFMLIVLALLSRLRNALNNERIASRTDFLTGAINSRSFCDLATMELDRLRRYGHPFSLIYLDIDNFKEINDSHGHLAGDIILRQVVQTTRDMLRASDTIARLGGDEFAFLLPETDALEARAVAAKIQAELKRIKLDDHVFITASLGVLTCREAPQNADALIQLGDELMYRVKNSGKKSAWFGEYPEPVQIEGNLEMTKKTDGVKPA